MWTNDIIKKLLVQRNSSKKLQAVLKQNEQSSKFGIGEHSYVCNTELVLEKQTNTHTKPSTRKEIGETQGLKAYLS